MNVLKKLMRVMAFRSPVDDVPTIKFRSPVDDVPTIKFRSPVDDVPTIKFRFPVAEITEIEATKAAYLDEIAVAISSYGGVYRPQQIEGRLLSRLEDAYENAMRRAESVDFTRRIQAQLEGRTYQIKRES